MFSLYAISSPEQFTIPACIKKIRHMHSMMSPVTRYIEMLIRNSSGIIIIIPGIGRSVIHKSCHSLSPFQ